MWIRVSDMVCQFRVGISPIAVRIHRAGMRRDSRSQVRRLYRSGRQIPLSARGKVIHIRLSCGTQSKRGALCSRIGSRCQRLAGRGHVRQVIRGQGHRPCAAGNREYRSPRVGQLGPVCELGRIVTDDDPSRSEISPDGPVALLADQSQQLSLVRGLPEILGNGDRRDLGLRDLP